MFLWGYSWSLITNNRFILSSTSGGKLSFRNMSGSGCVIFRVMNNLSFRSSQRLWRCNRSVGRVLRLVAWRARFMFFCALMRYWLPRRTTFRPWNYIVCWVWFLVCFFHNSWICKSTNRSRWVNIMFCLIVINHVTISWVTLMYINLVIISSMVMLMWIN